MNEEFAELKINNETYKLPIKKASIGPSVIDVSKLYPTTGYFTYDPGFMSTASCTSAITFIDGDEGVLRHRGYDIKDLANNKNFLEVSYLLLNSDLPNKKEYSEFKDKISYHSLLNEQIRNIFGAFRHSAHPMAVILSVVGSLSAFYHDSIDMNSPEGRELAAMRMIAKMPTIAAMTYKYTKGQAFVYPDADLPFTENFLHMMFATPDRKYKVNPTIARALDKIFILHADHEQNASTSTVRTAGSSGANPFACVSAGITSLWGPSHGGANEAVINMLKEIGTVSNIPKCIERAKDKEDPFRLMGFGHRVYKNYDPRAAVLRESCKEVLTELGQLKGNPLLEIAMELEKIALNDKYFIERKLYPNVDFYSGIIYEAMGIPAQMFTVLFAIARTAGWVSHWKEMWEDPEYKITRPRQLYKGHVLRKL
ncbi:Citrate synthase [Candidatus Megaera venefica]|jgi:citrate synthase|uniref:Citrate synthase n=1 Tax=Candidatus Megaera venefica TaxID=2055910 RepID=A0ABU5NAD2_9RICK|nr:citrate synthase [Candidatus Megaera venefica]MEA0970130.1 Citrate synthase [Candidatus Megaera venefica]